MKLTLLLHCAFFLLVLIINLECDMITQRHREEEEGKLCRIVITKKVQGQI